MRYWLDREEEEDSNCDSEDSNAEDYYDRICDAYGYEESEKESEDSWNEDDDWTEEEWDEEDWN